MINYDTFNTLKERMKTKFPVLLEGYLRDSKSYLVTIETNLPEGDINAVINAAHSLKSASGLLGINHVHKAAEALEYAGKDLLESGAQQYGDLNLHSTALQSAFSAVEGDLRNELSRAK